MQREQPSPRESHAACLARSIAVVKRAARPTDTAPHAVPVVALLPAGPREVCGVLRPRLLRGGILRGARIEWHGRIEGTRRRARRRRGGAAATTAAATAATTLATTLATTAALAASEPGHRR